MQTICIYRTNRSGEFKLVIHVRSVLGAALAALHLAGVVALHPALFVPPERISSEIGVLLIEVLLGLVGLFGCRGLIISMVRGKKKEETYSDNSTDEIQRQTIPKDRLDKHP